MKKLSLFKARLNGGALFYTLLIALLLAIICACFLTLFVNQKSIIDQLLLQNQLKLNLKSARIALLNSSSDHYKNPDTLSLFNDQKDSVSIHRTRWGAFELGSIEAFHSTNKRRISVQEKFFIGELSDSLHRASLFLQDFGKPLIVSDKTKIEGDVYLPKKGVKSGFINKKGYKGSRLIYGNQKQSKQDLPALRSTFKKWLHDEFSNNKLSLNTVSIPDSLSHSFSEPTLVFKKENIHLNGNEIKGNILLTASREIHISANAVLENVILLAPKIYFESGFIGNLQAFASKELIVSEEVHLVYPSVAAIVSIEEKENTPILEVKKNAIINGAILGINPFPNQQIKRNLILLHPESFVEGQIYSNGICQVQGTVYGNLMARKIIYNNSATVYENHLVNAFLDSKKRHKAYLNPPIFKKLTQAKILKWLD